jgi:hypothetical protein
MAADRAPGQIWPQTDPGQNRRLAAYQAQANERKAQLAGSGVGDGTTTTNPDLQHHHGAQIEGRFAAVGRRGEERGNRLEAEGGEGGPPPPQAGRRPPAAAARKGRREEAALVREP